MKFLLLVTMVTVSFAADESEWSYGNQEVWGGVCNKGARESPINIAGSHTMLSYKSKVTFPAEVEIELRTEGLKTVQLDIVGDTPAIIKMPKTWPVGHNKGLQALQIHFHWGREDEGGSEHRLFGIQYAGEAHLVCRNLDQEDKTAGDAYAVFGLFLALDDEYADEGNNHLLELLNGETTTLQMTTVYEYGLNSYMFTYEGGLTTPGCDEKVYWHVLGSPLDVSTDLMKKLRSFGGENYDINYREVQPLNERKVIYRILDGMWDTVQEEEAKQCNMDCYAAEQKCRWSNTAAIIFPSIFLLLIALFSLL